MKTNNEVEWKIPFIDFLVGLLGFFFLLFVFILALVSPEEEKKAVGLETKAEYVITSTWADNEDCDVDMWIYDPLEKYTSFQSKVNGFITLDRDDRGIQIDTFTGPDGKTYTYPDNKEIGTIRKIIPGEYRINLHLYNCRTKGSTANPGDDKVLSVNFEVMRLNPKVESVFKKTITFTKIWEEQTLVHFAIDADGNYKYLDNNYVRMKDGDNVTSSTPYSSSGGIAK